MLTLCGLALSHCGEEMPTNPSSQRWYSAQQQQAGQEIFLANCAVCHGEQGQGLVANWRSRQENGAFPPPPLNGTAHTWHHPRSVLAQVIADGGIPLGGMMPGFAEQLSEEEIFAVIAFIQSLWSDEIYGQWLQMGGTN